MPKKNSRDTLQSVLLQFCRRCDLAVLRAHLHSMFSKQFHSQIECSGLRCVNCPAACVIWSKPLSRNTRIAALYRRFVSLLRCVSAMGNAMHDRGKLLRHSSGRQLIIFFALHCTVECKEMTAVTCDHIPHLLVDLVTLLSSTVFLLSQDCEMQTDKIRDEETTEGLAACLTKCTIDKGKQKTPRSHHAGRHSCCRRMLTSDLTCINRSPDCPEQT